MNISVNVYVDAIAVVVLLAMVAGSRKKQSKNPMHQMLYVLMGLCLAILTLDILGWMLDGRIFFGARLLLTSLNTLYYALQIVYCFIWLAFSDYWHSEDMFAVRRRARWYALPMVAELALILANPRTGWIFSVNAANVYARGKWYTLNLTPYYLYILASLTIAGWAFFRAKDVDGRRQSLSLTVFMLLPVCGTVLTTFTYGTSWIWPFSALSLLMTYLYVQQKDMLEEKISSLRSMESAARLENEMIQLRVKIMLSQIQPHFLYNVLGTIRELCRLDPALAEKAVLELSGFLRGSLSSLSDDKRVPFLRELSHTNSYLSLEKMRFGDRLNLVYETEAHDFTLPTLTLQPLVENAVRYGVTKREEGGTVSISTREQAEAFVVTVQDDGVGFDPEAPHKDGRTHIGIQNVRERIERMCGGTLTINSTPGVGTVAVIRLPKEYSEKSFGDN